MRQDLTGFGQVIEANFFHVDRERLGRGDHLQSGET